MEHAAWGEYLLIPAEQGPDVLGWQQSPRPRQPRRQSLLHHYIGLATADYGLTTEQRNIISFDEFV